jgi:hypothetical protein
MRRIVSALTAVMLVAVACGDGGGSDDAIRVATTTSTTSTTTSTTGLAEMAAAPPPAMTTTTTTTTVPRYAAPTDLGIPEPLPGSGGAHGSGCDVEEGTLPDGAWFGVALASDGMAITFEVACFYTGPEAMAAAALAGGEVEQDYFTAPGGVVYLVPIGIDATMYALHYDEDAGSFYLLALAMEDWPDLDSDWHCLGELCRIWLYVNGGVATEGVEQYLP